MIPLSRWLVEEPRLASRPVEGAASVELDSSGDDARLPSMEAQLEDARTAGRIDALSVLDRQVLMARAEERAVCQDLLHGVEAKWSGHCEQLAGANFDKLLNALKHWLGESISSVLRPFVEDRISAKASHTLLQLLDDAISGSHDAVLEIRAPEALHDRLSELLLRKGIGASITASDRIELIARTESCRFAVMTAKWLESLGAEAP